ncbi:MAG: peptidoglycan-binding protein [Candidatus Marinimicrobia bacterium]|nr:peptidoglycan-binding protein [Candidatus Neomarinimicrobiota bacterium]
MKNFYKCLLLFVFCAVFLPSSSYASTASDLQAQITALLAQVQTLQNQLSTIQTTITTSGCPNITSDLYLGVENSQVTALQNYLANDSSIYPEKLVTGYYGSLTEKAVQRWQAKYGVVSSGSADTTGYGVVGPKTRAKMNSVCGGTSTIIQQTASGVYEPKAGTTLVQNNSSSVKWTKTTASSGYVNVWLVSQNNSSLHTLIASSESVVTSSAIRIQESTTSFLYTPSQGLANGSYYIKVCYSQFQTKNQTQNCMNSSTFNLVATNPILDVSSIYVSDGVTPAGTNDVVFGKYVLDTSGSSESIKISSIDFGYEDNGYQTSLSGCYLYEDSKKLNDALVPSKGVQTFSLNSPLIINKNTSKTIILKCNVAAWTMESPFYRWTFNDAYAVGFTSSSTAIVDTSDVSAGPKISVVYPNAFLASVSSQSEVSGTASQGELVTAGIFDISAASEDIFIDFIPVTFTGTTKDDLVSVSLWDGDTRLGLACVPCSSSDEIYVYMAWVVPVSTPKTLTLKAQLASNAGVGGNFRLGINAEESKGTSATSHAQVTGSPKTTLYGSFMTIVE